MRVNEFCLYAAKCYRDSNEFRDLTMKVLLTDDDKGIGIRVGIGMIVAALRKRPELSRKLLDDGMKQARFMEFAYDIFTACIGSIWLARQ